MTSEKKEEERLRAKANTLRTALVAVRNMAESMGKPWPGGGLLSDIWKCADKALENAEHEHPPEDANSLAEDHMVKVILYQAKSSKVGRHLMWSLFSREFCPRCACVTRWRVAEPGGGGSCRTCGFETDVLPTPLVHSLQLR